MPKYYIPKKDFYVIPFEQVKRMIKVTDDIRMKAILALIWVTGARIGEILKLRKEDFTVDLNTDTVLILIPTLKGGSPRELELSINDTPTMKEIILPYLAKRDNLLFDIGRRRTQQLLQKINKETDYWLTFHQFRHSRITYLARKERASTAELMDWTGWNTSRQVGTYIIKQSSKRFKNRIR